MNELTEVWTVRTETNQNLGVFRYLRDAKEYQSRISLVTTVTLYPIQILP